LTRKDSPDKKILGSCEGEEERSKEGNRGRTDERQRELLGIPPGLSIVLVLLLVLERMGEGWGSSYRRCG